MTRPGRCGSDELDPERGDLLKEPALDCSLLCALAETEIT
jgi:hypothetical protein